MDTSYMIKRHDLAQLLLDSLNGELDDSARRDAEEKARDVLSDPPEWAGIVFLPGDFEGYEFVTYDGTTAHPQPEILGEITADEYAVCVHEFRKRQDYLMQLAWEVVGDIAKDIRAERRKSAG